MLRPIDLECEFGLQHRAAAVTDLDTYLLGHTIPPRVDGIPGHIRQRASRLFLHLFYGGEFQTFLIGNDLIALTEVKIEPVHTARTKPTRKCSFSELQVGGYVEAGTLPRHMML